jgi:ribosome-associated toxin RatA of RatAB toxin-antitoxin module
MTQREQSQGRFEESRTIEAPAEQVFAFVANVSNLPKYIPTTKQAMPDGEDRVRVQGEAAGHRYDSDGFLRADEDSMTMEWGADEHYYAGQMQIQPAGADRCNVTVRLNFRERPKDSRPSGGPSDADIREGLQKALVSIENHVTGKGGKEEPRAAS